MVVAHPDDEVIWCGGLILQSPGWDWTVLSLCRATDENRRPKFKRVCERLGAEGIISDLDDSSPLRPLYPPADIGWRIRQYTCDQAWDLCLTHGPDGEYGHPRHRQVHAEVRRLAAHGLLHCAELWTFAYACDATTGVCRGRDDADLRVPLTTEQLGEKRRIVHEMYGYACESFEVRACISPEAFYRHGPSDQGALR